MVWLVLQGAGALYAITAGAPTFVHFQSRLEELEARQPAQARTNLDVYSKSETDNQITGSTSVAYTTTLAAASWVLNGDMYTQTYSNTALTCGKAGKCATYHYLYF